MRQLFKMMRPAVVAWPSTLLNYRQDARRRLRNSRPSLRTLIGVLRAVPRNPRMPVPSSNAMRLVQPGDINGQAVIEHDATPFIRAAPVMPAYSRRSRHARACRGHPRLDGGAGTRGWPGQARP